MLAGQFVGFFLEGRPLDGGGGLAAPGGGAVFAAPVDVDGLVAPFQGGGAAGDFFEGGGAVDLEGSVFAFVLEVVVEVAGGGFVFGDLTPGGAFLFVLAFPEGPDAGGEHGKALSDGAVPADAGGVGIPVIRGNFTAIDQEAGVVKNADIVDLGDAHGVAVITAQGQEHHRAMGAEIGGVDGGVPIEGAVGQFENARGCELGDVAGD